MLAYLRAFDEANKQAGAVRNTKKTEVIFYATRAELTTNSSLWQLEELRRQATLLTPEEANFTLGVAVGGPQAVAEQLQQKVEVVRAMHSKIVICQDVQTENVLSKQSLGIGRINHILRVHGHALLGNPEQIRGFDDIAKTTLDRLFPGLSSNGHEQASLACKVGGLGRQRAVDTALPANLSALILAAPKIRSMAEAAQRAGLIDERRVQAQLDRKVQAAHTAYLEGLGDLEKRCAETFLQKARAAAEEQWLRYCSGGGSEAVQTPASVALVDDDEVGPSLNLSTNSEDEAPDVEAGGRRLSAPHLQRELSRLFDVTRLRTLQSQLRTECAWEQLDRLKELRHKEVSHKWLWHLDSRKGSVLSEADYIANVQRRLGARIYEGSEQCRICGAVLDPYLEHSETCATAEATKGHYACVRSLVEGLRLADPQVCTEPRGLTNTQTRPADILTTAAVPGRSAALDVCVASPNAAAARGDAAEAAFKRKLAHYRRVIPQLAAAGIAFRPLIWTADARPHPAAVRTLKYAASLAATRSGVQADSSALLSRWKHEVTISILRRRAAMSRAVVPRRNAMAEWLLTGVCEDAPSSETRAMELDVADDKEAAFWQARAAESP